MKAPLWLINVHNNLCYTISSMKLLQPEGTRRVSTISNYLIKNHRLRDKIRNIVADFDWKILILLLLKCQWSLLKLINRNVISLEFEIPRFIMMLLSQLISKKYRFDLCICFLFKYILKSYSSSWIYMWDKNYFKNL